jgi:hypothetical protein
VEETLEQLKSLARYRGASYPKIAKGTDLSLDRVGRLLRGERPPREGELEKIAEFLTGRRAAAREQATDSLDQLLELFRKWKSIEGKCLAQPGRRAADRISSASLVLLVEGIAWITERGERRDHILKDLRKDLPRIAREQPGAMVYLWLCTQAVRSLFSLLPGWVARWFWIALLAECLTNPTSWARWMVSIWRG